MDQKICRACGLTKNLSEFNRNSETADGYRYTCKVCRKNKVPVNPEISKANRHPTRQYSTRKSRQGLDPVQVRRAQKYGLTIEQLDTLYERQEGLCGICTNPLPVKFCIDHCHETGKVRGLLCYSCNIGLGQLGDSLEGLQRAVAYLTGLGDRPENRF